VAATVTVVGLRRPRAGDPTIEVVLESGDRLRVHDRRLAEHGLAVGAFLDPAALAKLERADAADAAERRALRLIARRPRSRSELARRLEGWGLGADDAARVLERLRGMGVLDDAALAAAVVSSRRAHAYGRLRIEADLNRLEVDPAVGDPVAATSAETEADRARQALHARRAPVTRDPADMRRAAAFLSRRGFDGDTVAAVLGFDDAC
jgi:regulatory protein